MPSNKKHEGRKVSVEETGMRSNITEVLDRKKST